MASRDRKARRMMLRYGAKDLRTMRDPLSIPRDKRTLADAFLGLSGEELKKVLLQGQMLAALDLANRPPEPGQEPPAE